MRYIRYAFLATLGFVLVSVAFANRGSVNLSLMPEAFERAIGLSYSIELPLFVVIFGAIISGLLIGFVWEWLREYKHRAEAARKTQEVQVLNRQLKREQRRNEAEAPSAQKDDVLALLDKAS